MRVRISFRRRRTVASRSRSVWHKRLMEAVRRVEKVRNRPGNIDDWVKATQARLKFAHIWYQYKLRYGRVATEDVRAYIVMTTI